MWLSNLVTTINHDQPVRRLEHLETQLTYTSRSSEQRELTTGLDVGAVHRAAYVMLKKYGMVFF